ncbi:MAG: zincin-like metallopeptidase domain-containing protein [Xanthobacteraceae bacterium]
MPNSRMANAGLSGLQRRPCGIIRIAALCPLCRYRHNGHWTGHKSRLDRDLKNRFGSRAYAAEELVAELAAAFLSAEFGFNGDVRNAGYIATWIELLKADKRAFFTACSRASQAADFLRDLVLAERPSIAA